MQVASQNIAALVGPAAPAHPTTPPNWYGVSYGDSRHEQGNAPAYAVASGISWLRYNTGVLGWIEPYTGGRIGLAYAGNDGISGGTTPQAATTPRQSSISTVTTGLWFRGVSGAVVSSGSNNKGFAAFNADTPGILFIGPLSTNDAGGGPSYSNIATYSGPTQAAFTSILQGVSSSRLIVLCSEIPKGVKPDGTNATGIGAPMTPSQAAAFKACSVDFIAKFAWNSGDALSLPNCMFVNLWNVFVNPASGVNLTNLPGLLQNDGLHLMPRGAQLIDQTIAAQFATDFGAIYTALPSHTPRPTANGFAGAGNPQPYLNLNPIMTPGTAGTVTSAGSFGSAPTAATIPQTWNITPSGATGLHVSCDKTTNIDPLTGLPVWLIAVDPATSTIAVNATSTVILNEVIWANSAAVTTALGLGYFTYADEWRGFMRFRVDTGSLRLREVHMNVSPVVSPTNTGVLASMQDAYASLGIFWRDLSSAADAGSANYIDVWSDKVRLQDPGMATTNPVGGSGSGGPGFITSITSLQVQISLVFDNNPGAAGNAAGANIYIAQAGIVRV